MEHVLVSVFAIHTMILFTNGMNLGFTVKLQPQLDNEKVKQKLYETLFSKISQEKAEAGSKRNRVPKQLSNLLTMVTGCTNQKVRMYPPCGSSQMENETQPLENNHIGGLPLFVQPYERYKILVAVAPPHLKITANDDPLVVYIVFSDDENTPSDLTKIPTIYFVQSPNAPKLNKRDAADPIFIIDSKRMVTHLRTKDLQKLVKFRVKNAL